MSWIASVFGQEKPIIGMVHLLPLPGSPLYDNQRGMEAIVEAAAKDVEALQSGGIDAVMFCNENDRPYVIDSESETVAAMSYVIGRVRPEIRVPFGVDILWDPIAAISVAHAVSASFVREVFTGTYASDMGWWVPQAGAALRHRRNLGANDVHLLFNINAEFASSIDQRALVDVARSVAFSSLPDALCVSGMMTGVGVDPNLLAAVRQAVNVPVFSNTGLTPDTVDEILRVADGAIVGTALKVNGVTFNPVDPRRVSRLMDAVHAARSHLREEGLLHDWQSPERPR
ncbi:MAG: BtpA/SgcQ family protein [Firmicutes bacterium]|nr:BtpA/SgcQ family protein [Bacillota bacterium]